MSSTKQRRAYIGNIRPRPNLSHNLYNDLFLPHGLHVKNYPPINSNGDEQASSEVSGIVVAAPKMSNNRHHYAKTEASSNYALVKFDDVDYAIRILNGVVFDGRTLRVSKEKTNFGNGSGSGRGGRNNFGAGFGSSRWAGDDGGGWNGGGTRSSKGKQHRNKESRAACDNKSALNGSKNNATQKDGRQIAQNDVSNHYLNGEELVVKGVESLVASEINGSEDEVAAAIACTAAMTLLSSIDAFGLEKEESALSEVDPNLGTGANANEPKDKNIVDDINMTNNDFQSRCKVPLSDLLAEYGEQDTDWKSREQKPAQPQNMPKNEDKTKKDDFQSRCQMPLSDLMAEYGEQDVDWRNDQPEPSTKYVDNKQDVDYTKRKPQSAPIEHKDTNGMLAHFNNSSIHLELVSFGYKYGAPSHSKRGFTYAHPLPPLDVRDLDRAPGHVAKFTGLSHLVKRALLNPSTKSKDDAGQCSIERKDGGVKIGQKQGQQSAMRLRANEMADEIIAVLVESIDEGGHGAISPLTMTISIGSEYGRHRAVVLVEHLAIVLRARLRRNDGQRFNHDTGEDGKSADSGGKNNGIVRQPVSVGTRHRDVDARHKDEEAFGEDLKREARKAEKQARRQQMEDDGWDGGGW